MASPPDKGIATMAVLLGDALRHLDDALSKLKIDDDQTTASADAAIAAQRELEAAYYAGMVELLGVEDRTERIARRELYRRSSRIGEAVVDVAEQRRLRRRQAELSGRHLLRYDDAMLPEGP
jgi:hypothetical protein